MQHAQEQVKHIVDGASITIVLGALVEFLPAIAALVSIVWGIIRIYETNTVQRWLGKTHRRKDDPPNEKLKGGKNSKD
jgi:hypothetical protein